MRYFNLLIFLFSVCSVGMSQQSGFRLGRQINNGTHDYLPCPTPDGNHLYFTGMDRTGFFDFKLDFISQPNSGGEDIFHTTRTEAGFWEDSKAVFSICTNGHEAITQALSQNELMVTANYPENLGIKSTSAQGTETADLFHINLSGSSPRVEHLPEPVNSMYNEADGWTFGNYLLFVSDRPGAEGEYHLKGWDWNGHYWGNTDVYVAVQGDFGWDQIIKLPSNINSPGPERTPRLSHDGLTLWVSTWREGKGLEVMEYVRNDKNDWLHWEGPKALNTVNTPQDDWGYIELRNGQQFWSSALPLSYTPTAPAPGGDNGSFRETNFRTGYTIFGRQTASLLRETQTDIFSGITGTNSHLILQNILFNFDSDQLKDAKSPELEKLIEICRMNKNATILIHGHTDHVGDDKYNLDLSKRRAETVADFLRKARINNDIQTLGHGSSEPLSTGSSKSPKSQNRRVEIEFL